MVLMTLKAIIYGPKPATVHVLMTLNPRAIVHGFYDDCQTKGYSPCHLYSNWVENVTYSSGSPQFETQTPLPPD